LGVALKSFGWLDYLVLVAYLAAVTLLGSSFYKRKTTPKDYFLGSRSFGWIPVGISIIAADTSAITVMGSVAWSFHHDLQTIWITFGYLIMAPVVIRVFIPFYTSLELYTAYEYLEKRFNLAVRLVASALFQFLRSVHVALAIYAPSLIINLVTGLPLWECIIFMGVLCTIYTTMGGMKAVIWTDVIQFSVVSVGIATVLIMAIGRIQGGAAAAYHISSNAGRLSLFNFSFDPSSLTSFWACILGGSILNLAPLTTDQAVLQRMFSTRSAQDCQRSVWLNAFISIPMVLALLLIGAVLFAFYQQHPERLVGLSNGDTILAFFAVRELPAGLSGLLIAALFAASMGVMSAGINALSTATTVDFYIRVLRPGETAQHYANTGRVFTACWGLAGTALALLGGKLGELAIAYSRVSSFVSGPILGVFLLGMLSRRTASGAALSGAAAGAASVVLLSLRTNWSFFYMAPIAVLVTVGAGLFASLFIEAPSVENVNGLVLQSHKGVVSGRV
jgi:SSS family transporter